jgi:hypothetical protein
VLVDDVAAATLERGDACPDEAKPEAQVGVRVAALGQVAVDMLTGSGY